MSAFGYTDGGPCLFFFSSRRRHTRFDCDWSSDVCSSELRERFEAMRIFVESEEPHRSHEPEEPPVLLRNPKPVKPFEFLVHLYSTPNYHELDPTQFLSLAAPFFFGFMIGDAGYGALFVALGIIAMVRLNRESIWWRIFMVTAIGGGWAFLLGMFIFGEAFGVS